MFENYSKNVSTYKPFYIEQYKCRSISCQNEKCSMKLKIVHFVDHHCVVLKINNHNVEFKNCKHCINKNNKLTYLQKYIIKKIISKVFF